MIPTIPAFPTFDPAAIRALTVRLVACRSVSPDVPGETRCARELEAALPPEIERGEWRTRDGRPTVWALVPGRTPTTLVLLGHYDTVGVGEFASLGAPAGEAIAFDPFGLRQRLLRLAEDGASRFPAAGLADLHAEARAPGTWLFGRGGLDMKSGLAVAVAVVTAAARLAPPPACGLLFIATPDEERESTGMITAVRGLRALRDARGLALAGVLNVDYVAERCAYVGAMGKLELGVYVLGRPAHAGAPHEGVDAVALAAEVVTRVTRSRALVDEADGVHAAPPVTLRLRDLKLEYNVQTAREAYVEFNLITVRRPLARTLDLVRTECVRGLEAVVQANLELAAWADPTRADSAPVPDPAGCVMTYAELLAHARLGPGDDPLAVDREPAGPPATTSEEGGATPGDAREATLSRLRALVRLAELDGPRLVIHLLPPFYPHAAPGEGPLVRAVRAALAGERGVPVRAYYPLISDACYASWRAEPPEEIASQMPALGREYALPVEDARALDLDVVSLGPWGHDAHGLLERVHAAWTFERLPQLVWKILNHVSELAMAGDGTPEA